MKDVVARTNFTEMLMNQTVAENAAIQQFFDTLDSEQKQRFLQIGHNLLYIGFENGIDRMPTNIPEEARARRLIRDTEIYLQGAGEASE